MDTPQNEQSTPENDQQHFYFLVSGEIEYTEGKYNKSPKYLKVNTVFQSPLQGLTAAQLGKCQVNLQMNFHNRYSKTHREPPVITYCTILHTSFLGTFSEKEFLDDAPTQSGPDVLEELALKGKEEVPPTKSS